MNRTLTAQRHQQALDSDEWEEYLGRMDNTRSMMPRSRMNWMMSKQSQSSWSATLMSSSAYDRGRSDAKLLYFNPVSALDLPGNQ